ncbi:MAG TPA: OsmC family protein [Acidimicrobiales bacterium]|nr:OsmC family protein [Acidimicrobiales bacterium]
MTTTESPVRNGVDTATLFATINAVGEQRDLARFQFRATNTWMSGTHSRSSISSFYGAGQEMAHMNTWDFDADHPVVLTGKDNGPAPVEFMLVGLAGCLTAGLANIAAARGVTLHSVESTVEGDIDLQGIFGLSREVRNGYQQIRVSFRIDADASPDKIRELVAQSQARSAVFDIITNQVPVAVDVTAA